MSLRIRFLLLLGILGISVALLAGSAFWSFSLLRREVVAPFQSTSEILSGLTDVKRGLEAQATRLLAPNIRDAFALDQPGAPTLNAHGVRGTRWTPPGTTPNAIDRADYAHETERIQARIEALQGDPWFSRRLGAVAAGALRARTFSALDSGLCWYDSADADARADAVNEMFELHEMIEMLESRVLDDADLAIAYTARLEERLVIVIGLSLVIALVMAVLSFALFRRWITLPVARLRSAARRIGAGDFEHRIPITGRDELAELSHEVNEMASTVLVMQEERVQRERLAATGELIRQLSHNLRNPLSGIRGVAEVTQRKLPEDSSLRENLGRIITSVDRLDLWLRDLLSSTSPVAVAPETHRPAPWLEQVLAAHRPTADHKSVSLILETEAAPETAVFDRRRLEQALTAIITNAIQATPSDGSVTIAAHSVRESPTWRITVSDTGPGVPRELHQRIFQAHFTTKPDGSGIGLASAMQIVRAHGGELGVSDGSEPSNNADRGRSGAVFTITLPLESGPVEADQ
ncbi:MAG: HAMP domain-containing histidine kinase [Phycisphaeraceae bacterium]|nr:HAMP domain-containing histidine kinase [Phycisphaeraceae bacterium]MCB9847794.1 HAMP domain-containing histidine kinase [Phycisphaeraceae bacterium]